MNLRYISWKEFDDALASMPKPICDSFYPIPRGGMVLAVALSHRFGKPIAYLPTKLSILVDDIVDSGRTLTKTRIRYPYPAYVLCKRSSCKINAVTYGIEILNDDWIVFPWENKEKALEDYEQYIINQRSI
jgi:hypoxanthine phosphoribosyltransferase